MTFAAVAAPFRRALRAAVRALPARPAPPTVYILTAYDFNHVQRKVPIDARFLAGGDHYQFYFFDRDGIPPGFQRGAVAERDIHPGLWEIGKKHLAEWTFFLAEYERPFARYPFVAVSSRFYEKNAALRRPLDQYLPRFGQYLQQYGYGYLPSYDRQFGMVDLMQYDRAGWLGSRTEGYRLIEELYGVRMPTEYRYTGDYWCNYLAFQSRAELVRYVEFYLPLIRQFFDRDYRPIRSYEGIVVNRTGSFREEKPLTLFLEQASHLFFYKQRLPYFGLHYDGFYEVSEHTASFRKLEAFPEPGHGGHP